MLFFSNHERILFLVSELCIARYKAENPAAADIVIATKFFPAPFKLFYPSSLINALRASLARLKVSQFVEKTN